MSTPLVQQVGSCPCGAASFTVHGRPLARFYCHCEICQQLYNQPFVDVSAFAEKAITVSDPAAISFRKYRKPPALQRGTCRSCGQPVVGFLHLGPLPGLAFLATRNLSEPEMLPSPRAHIFCHRKVAAIQDALPQISGYWRSEWAVFEWIGQTLLRPA
ncbi:GFA family protein [Marinobacteraceae bacterium S3BR75-40.1]